MSRVFFSPSLSFFKDSFAVETGRKKKERVSVANALSYPQTPLCKHLVLLQLR